MLVFISISERRIKIENRNMPLFAQDSIGFARNFEQVFPIAEIETKPENYEIKCGIIKSQVISRTRP